MKKIISLALVCIMMLGMLSMVSFAAPAAIGESTTTWEITGTTLTIGGTGAMPDFRGVETTRPWVDSIGTITKVVVEDGVTHVGSSSFTGAGELVEVVYGAGATTFGMDATSGCGKLAKITFKAAVTEIGQGTVYGSGNIASVTLGGGQTWAQFEEIAKVKSYNDNYFKCKEYAVAAIQGLGTVNLTVSPWSLENWGKDDAHTTFHGTFFVTELQFKKGEENVNAAVNSAIKNGLVKVTVTIVDETAEKRYTIDDYKFDYDAACQYEGCGNDAAGHCFYDNWLYRFGASDYGVELVAGNTYTLSVKITCDGKLVAEGSSDTGAFTCPEDPQVVAQPAHSSVVTDLSEPAPEPVDPPKNGDATVFAVVFAAVAVLGMAVVVTKKVHA